MPCERETLANALGGATLERPQLVALRSIPFDEYSEVFRPWVIPPETPGIGSVADDVNDIYTDVAAGLRLYEGGNRVAALWEWTFSFASHWGAHATGAIRALHAWLAAHAADCLAKLPER